MKILSICIPTLNRAKSLDRLLANLAEEIRPVRDDVEVCISDNCSADETQKIISKWKKDLPLVLSRNKSVLGYDLNLLAAARLASGRYMWFLGDDDKIVEDTIKRLVADLSGNDNENMTVVYMNALLRKRWVTKCDFDGFIVFKKSELPVKPNISFGGSICLRTETANKVMEDITVVDGKLRKGRYDDFVLHDFVHSYLFMECLKAGKQIGVEPVHGVCIIADGNPISFKKKLYIELILVKYILEMKKQYPDFKEAGLILDSKMRVIGRTFINSALAAQTPEAVEAYRAYRKIVLKVLELEGRTLEKTVLELGSAFRKVPLIGWLHVVAFNIMRKLLKLPLENRPENNQMLDGNMGYALANAGHLLQEGKR